MVGTLHSLPLKVSSSDGHNFTLLESFSFTRPNGDVITVPVGSTSDGASTPRELWLTLPPFGDYWPAAYLHDWLYRESILDKDTCDIILAEAMEACGTEWIVRNTIYEGVRLGGWSSFTNDRSKPKVVSGD